MKLSHSLVVSAAGLAAFVLASLAGCSNGGSSDSGSSDQVRVDILVQDAPSDHLLSFTATVQEIRLVSDTGPGSNLLNGNVTLEFIGLQSSAQWLARDKVNPKTYDAIEFTFDPDSVVAIDKTGSPVAVTMTDNVLTANFIVPFNLDSSTYGDVLVDLDLANSLSGSIIAPPLTFDPVGSAIGGDGGLPVPIDELKGKVESSSATDQEVVVKGFVDDDLNTPIGNVTVNVQPTTVLLGEDGTTLSNSAFFGLLVDGATVLEIHGALIDGVVRATRIDVEDAQGGSDDSYQVKMEGLVKAIGPGQQFELLITEIEKGADIADPVLAGLGDPASIIVSYDALTLFFLSDSTTISDDTALELGGRVKVKFPTFVAQPFYASMVELGDGPEFEGTITDVSGLPNTIVMHLDIGELAISSGQVDSSTTDVIVDLTASTINLDSKGKPSLLATQLQAGLGIEVHGALTGPSSGPTIASTKLVVHAGRFVGTVFSTAPGSHSFVANVLTVNDPFGDTVTTPPFDVLIDPGCVFDGDASSELAFYALFDGLAVGEVLTILVEGIGTANLDEVLAYRIKAQVETIGR